MNIQTFTAAANADRLDSWLALQSGLSRCKISQLIDEGMVLLNGKQTTKKAKIRQGDTITLKLLPKQNTPTALIPQDLGLKVVYIDDHLAVIDKPASMVVYPAVGHPDKTLLNGLAYIAPSLASVGMPLRPGVVHRLDKDTSGLIVVALNDTAYYHLCSQFKTRTIQRQYIALAYGQIPSDVGQINRAIGRSNSDRKKMSVVTNKGKDAITYWEVIKRFASATMLRLKLGSGRTHQIRVHLASLGHPVLGDVTYGKKTALIVKNQKILFSRQMLHACTLTFVHPHSNELMTFNSDIPEDMKVCINKLL